MSSRRESRSLFSTSLLACFLFVSLAANAQTAQLPSGPVPELTLSANNGFTPTLFQGWPIVLELQINPPDQFVPNGNVDPVVLSTSGGNWTDAVQITVLDPSAAPQNWPLTLVPPAGGQTSASLASGVVARLFWTLSPSTSTGLPAGVYQVVATLDTTTTATTGSFKGRIQTSVTITVASEPSPLPRALEQEKFTILAAYDVLLGNNAQALADINTLLTNQPNNTDAMVEQGDLLMAQGQLASAIASYDQAASVFAATFPSPAEPPKLITSRLNRARAQLISQSGTVGIPEVSLSIGNSSTHSPGIVSVDLALSNGGNGVAATSQIFRLSYTTVAGTGKVSYDTALSPAFPIIVDTLDPGDSSTLTIFLDVPPSVSQFTINADGRAADEVGTLFDFHAAQSISANSAGGTPPGALTITANNATQQYGQATPSLNNVTYSGFANGDTPASLGGSLNCTTSATPASSVGQYPITCSGLTSASYTITFVPGTLTVTPAPLTVTANDSSVQYGRPFQLSGAAFSGFISGDNAASLIGVLTCTTPATQASPVGSYAITCSGVSSPNYNVTLVPGTLTILPGRLTLTASDTNRPYGAPNPPLNNVTASGFVNGDTLSSLVGTLSCTTIATSASPAGAYQIVCSGLTSMNYSIIYVPGILTISSDVLTIAANNAARQYGAANPTFTVAYSGFVNGDGPASLSGTLNCASTATSVSPVGNYPISCTGLSSTSYSITYVPGQLAVTPASLTITANNATRQYGQPNPTFTASFGPFMNSETPAVLVGTLLCVSAATPSSAVSGSPYSINCSGLSSTNYAISYIAGQLTVTPAPLTITANNAARQGGQANPPFTATFTGFANGESAAVLAGTLSCTTTATGNSPAGNYPITCAGLTSTNYAISYVPGQLTVTALTCATDVSSSIGMTRSGISYNVLTKRYAQTITLRNNSALTIGGPILLVLDSLGTNATLYNRTGSTTCAAPPGSPYVSIAGPLNAGASISVVLQFTNTTNAPITYTARVLSGAGQP